MSFYVTGRQESHENRDREGLGRRLPRRARRERGDCRDRPRGLLLRASRQEAGFSKSIGELMRQPVEFVARVVGSRSRSVEGLIRRMRCCFNTPVILTFDERVDLRRRQLPPEVQRPRVRDVIIHCVEGTAG